MRRCPFCGGVGEVKKTFSLFAKPKAYVKCTVCGAKTMTCQSRNEYDTVMMAKMLWQRRKNEDEKPHMVIQCDTQEELEKIAEAIQNAVEKTYEQVNE